MKLPKAFVPDKNLDEKTRELLNPQRKKGFKYAPKLNRLKVGDENVQYFLDLWCEQACTSDDTQKNLVAESYCIHILGVSKKVFESFQQNQFDADTKVGMRQGGAVKRKDDSKSFWSDMKRLYPLDYIPEDLDFLIKSGGMAAFQLLDQFQTYGPNSLLRKLRTNAHVYK